MEMPIPSPFSYAEVGLSIRSDEESLASEFQCFFFATMIPPETAAAIAQSEKISAVAGAVAVEVLDPVEGFVVF